MTQDQLVQISATDESFDYWIGRDYVSAELRERLSEANVLFTPYPGYLEYEGPLFPIETSEFFRYLQGNAGDGVIADVCIEDEDLEYLSLNHDVLELPNVLVKLLVAPMLVNLICGYILYRLGSRIKDASVEQELTIEDSRTGLRLKTKYKGPASKYDEFVGSIVRLLKDGDDLRTLAELEDAAHEERITRLSERRKR
ncbi:MAG: hypothetical protein OXI34_05485 [Chloroflexota bacterium]|nr:hypothetical protein [Chloroflexota bacterium]MDE2946484.1 hypothetical protein [Chloroflexota bacterium]